MDAERIASPTHLSGEDATDFEEASSWRKFFTWPYAGRLLKSSFGFAICASGIWIGLERSVFLSSSSAVVAGELEVISAPIDGQLRLLMSPQTQTVGGGVPVATVDNARVDRSALFALAAQLRAARVDATTIDTTLSGLKTIATRLDADSTSFRAKRVDQLRILLAETDAKLEAQKALQTEAVSRLARTELLSKEGLATEVTLADAQKDLGVTSHEAEAAKQERLSIEKQLQAARLGVQVDTGGLGADKPYSAQRLDEVDLRILEWSQKSLLQSEVVSSLQEQYDLVHKRIEDQSHAELRSSMASRVWDVTATDGGFVSKGQPVLKLLKCNNLSVVALVTERVFNKLRIGGKATFSERESGTRFDALITNLEGVSEGGGALRVAPGLAPEPGDFRVVLGSEGLSRARRDSCTVGRTGKIRFE